MGRPDRVLVVGGGIAGLGTARALLRQGIECDVVERAGDWENSGVGMYLPANAVRALDALGLRTQVLDRGQEIARQRFLNERGRLLLDLDLSRFWSATGPCVARASRASRGAARGRRRALVDDRRRASRGGTARRRLLR